jgi:polyphosphate kinase
MPQQINIRTVSPKTKSEHINREVSWMAFNERVLQEAADPRNPLIERMRFLGIYSNNMDEFFRVRIASLRRMTRLGKSVIASMEDDPRLILNQVLELVRKQQLVYEKTFNLLELELRKENICILKLEDLSLSQQEFVSEYFTANVRHKLFPVMLHPNGKFPPLEDHTIYFAIGLYFKGKRLPQYAIMQIPPDLPRFVVLPAEGEKQYVMFIDDIIRLKLHRIFAIYDAERIDAYGLKVTRDAELDIDEDISKSLLQKMSTSVDKRKKGQYVRFLYDASMPPPMLTLLTSKMGITGIENIIGGGRYNNKKDLMSFPLLGRTDLCFEPRPPLKHPHLSYKQSLFSAIAKRDILLHYPYQQFDYVVNLIREAAIDPHVKTIRINLYRVSESSHIVNALINAVKNGVKVVVILELQARFDESNNIRWSKRLQEAGAQVIHGVPGLKVHSKLLLISRTEKSKSVRYGHIGTGNFHEKTAKIYSDLTLLTINAEITNEIKKVFDFFESNFQRAQFRHLLVSPFNMRRRLQELIKEEIKFVKKGKEAGIVLKLNNLVDNQLIRRLYEASQEGVKIQLLIRGVCSLVPGVKGLSENITVTSIVGRYLEHTRIFNFVNGGNPLYFISSADWMTRNLDFRVEVSAPILDPSLKAEIAEILRIQLSGNVKARVVDKKLKNKYVPRNEDEPQVHSQEELYQYYKAKLE